MSLGCLTCCWVCLFPSLLRFMRRQEDKPREKEQVLSAQGWVCPVTPPLCRMVCWFDGGECTPDRDHWELLQACWEQGMEARFGKPFLQGMQAQVRVWAAWEPVVRSMSLALGGSLKLQSWANMKYRNWKTLETLEISKFRYSKLWSFSNLQKLPNNKSVFRIV